MGFSWMIIFGTGTYVESGMPGCNEQGCESYRLTAKPCKTKMEDPLIEPMSKLVFFLTGVTVTYYYLHKSKNIFGAERNQAMVGWRGVKLCCLLS